MPQAVIVYSEERGESERFRPYGVPSEQWLKWVGQQFEIRHRAGERSEGQSTR